MDNTSESSPKTDPSVILIIDGWEIIPSDKENIFADAHTPFFKELAAKYPIAALNIGKGALSKNYSLLGGKDENISNLASERGVKQIKITEAEKYAYLAYFFNGEDGEKKPGEERVLVSSEIINDYASKPAMATPAISKQVVKSVKEKKNQLIVAAFANLDMAILSGDKEAVIAAAEIADRGMEKITKTVLNKNGSIFILACKGTMMSKNCLVPFIMVNKEWEGQAARTGEAPGGDISLTTAKADLTDASATILKTLGLSNEPKSGKTLIG